jgi:hypothetical protein
MVHSPVVGNISQLVDVQEQFAVEQFVPEAAVERFDIAVLPGAMYKVSTPIAAHHDQHGEHDDLN